MLQKKAGAYIVKRIGDELFAKPAPPAEDEPAEGAPAEGRPVVDELDGELFTDENGRPLGTAYKLFDVAVYVVTDWRDEAEAELERCLAEPNSRLFIRREDDRITGLVYASDPNRPSRRAEGRRPDEV